jgi:glucuronate isomerase
MPRRRPLLRPHQREAGDRRVQARALFDRFNIEFLATTEGPQDDLKPHHAIHESGWKGRVVTTYRPDAVIDVEHEQFAGAMKIFAEKTGEDVW